MNLIFQSDDEGECWYDAHFIQKFLNTAELYDELSRKVDWRQDDIQLYGKKISIPRLHCWYGEFSYQYSRIKLPASPMPKVIQQVRDAIFKETDIFYNGVLLNFYRDGSDSNGWHRDNEKELSRPIDIASVSLGQDRFFSIRKKGETKMTKKFLLEDGSLFVMKSPFQDFWEHSIPKTSRKLSGRINLTFRKG